MRLPGLCESCGKFRYVYVAPAMLWKLSVGMGVPSGICHECEHKRIRDCERSRNG